MKVVIDRFEGKYAVCQDDDGKMINIEKRRIPSDANESDVLFIDESGISIDYKETTKRKNEAQSLLNKLMGN